MAWKLWLILSWVILYKMVAALTCLPPAFGTGIRKEDCLKAAGVLFSGMPITEARVIRKFSLYNYAPHSRMPQGQTYGSCAIGFDIADGNAREIHASYQQIQLRLNELLHTCVVRDGAAGYNVAEGIVYVITNPQQVGGYGTCLAAPSPSGQRPLPRRLNLYQCIATHGLSPPGIDPIPNDPNAISTNPGVQGMPRQDMPYPVAIQPDTAQRQQVFQNQGFHQHVLLQHALHTEALQRQAFQQQAIHQASQQFAQLQLAPPQALAVTPVQQPPLHAFSVPRPPGPWGAVQAFVAPPVGWRTMPGEHIPVPGRNLAPNQPGNSAAAQRPPPSTRRGASSDRASGRYSTAARNNPVSRGIEHDLNHNTDGSGSSKLDHGIPDPQPKFTSPPLTAERIIKNWVLRGTSWYNSNSNEREDALWKADGAWQAVKSFGLSAPFPLSVPESTGSSNSHFTMRPDKPARFQKCWMWKANGGKWLPYYRKIPIFDIVNENNWGLGTWYLIKYDVI